MLLVLNSCAREDEPAVAAPEHIQMLELTDDRIEPNETQLLEGYLDTLSLEEKIGQLFYVTLGNLEYPELETDNQAKALSEEAINTLRQYKPGGVILMGGNVESDQQLRELTTSLQSNSEIPLFIGVDEEGGMVSRLGNAPGVTLENVGSMQAVGNTGASENAYDIGNKLGKGLNTLGFNMDFAPVADVLTNPYNYEIGSRSFGSNASLVAEMTACEIQGLQENGVSAVTKHFPGHGGVIGNSHTSLQYVDTSIETLQQVSFIPFEAAIAADTDVILVSHLVLTEVDPAAPSSLSDSVVTGLLREDLGYEGLVITDSFQMASITDTYTQEEAAVYAIQAGCDMILMPMEYMACYQALIKAVQDGQLTEEQIDAACMRVLQTKIKRGILSLS